MDWLRSDDTLWDKNIDIMDFEPAKSKVLVVAKQGRVCLNRPQQLYFMSS